MRSSEPESAHDLNALAALADGVLDAGDRTRVVEHLAGCRECRRVFATLAEAGAVGAAQGRRRLADRVRRLSVWLPLAATIVLVTGTGAWLLKTGPGPERPQPIAPPATRPEAGETVVPTPPSPVAPPSHPARLPPDATRGVAQKRVGGKTFRLVAGEWIDTGFDPLAGLPTTDVTTPAARKDLLARERRLRPYSALGPRVTVVLDGTVYRFGRASGR